METATDALIGIEEAYERRVDIVCPNHECCRGRARVILAPRQGGGSVPGGALSDPNPARNPGLWYRVDCTKCKVAKLWQSYTRGRRTMVQPYDVEPSKPAAATKAK
jgi:hypothetical protein